MITRFKSILAVVLATGSVTVWAEVFSVNVGAADYNVGAGTDPGALVADTNWYNINATDGSEQTCGSYTVAVSATGHWRNDGKTSQFLKGYLDENNAGTPVPITLTIGGLADGAVYDVILYCSSDNALGWSAKQVNGTAYTSGNAYYAVEGTTTWGSNGGGTPTVKLNALIVHRVTPDAEGKIVVDSERNGDFRGSLAAIQLVTPMTYKAVSGTVLVSALNAELPDDGPVELNLADGTVLEMDTDFVSSTVYLTGAGTATLKADTAPSCAKLDISRYDGVLKRTWSKNLSVGLNFVSERGAVKTGAIAETSWQDLTGATGTKALSTDGLTKVVWKANTVWGDTGTTGTFIKGYLDDGSEGCSAFMTGIPAENYDVIVYCTTDTGSKNLHHVEVNGTCYTWDSANETTAEGVAGWGQANQSDTPALGVNALRINGQSGPLFVHLPRISDTSRGCLSAIQIVAPLQTVEQDVTDELRISAINTLAGPNDSVKLNFADGVTILGDEALATGETAMSYVAAGSLSVSGAYGSSFVPATLTLPETGVLSYSDLAALPLPYATSATPGAKVVLSGEVTAAAENAEVGLGSAGTASIVQVFEFDGLDLTVPKLKLGNGKGSQTIVQKSGAITVTGTTMDAYNSSALFAHWPNTTVYDLVGGSFTAATAVRFGWDGTIDLRVGGGETAATFTTSGFAVGLTPGAEGEGRTRAATLTIKRNGVVAIGEFGLPFARSAGAQLVMAGGTLKVTETTTISSQKDLSVTADSTVEVAAGKTLTITGNTSGAGNLAVDLAEGAVLRVTAGCESRVALPADSTIMIELSDIQVAQGYTTAGLFGLGTTVKFVSGGEVIATAVTTEANPQATYGASGSNWFGDSGVWSDTQFDGAAATADATDIVTFNDNGTSPYEAVTVSVSGEKTVKAIEFLADTTRYTLAGDRVTTSGDVKLSGAAAVTVTAPLSVGGVLSLPAEKVLTVKDVTLSASGMTGAGALVLDPGEGNVLTITGENAGFTGPVTIKSGTVVMGSVQALGPIGRAASIRVQNGATLDTAGQMSGAYYTQKNKVILEGGATLTTSGDYSRDNKLAAVTTVTLEGEATIFADNGKSFSLATHYNTDRTLLALGDHTLLKTGSADLWLSCCNITGTGTVEVRSGRLVFVKGDGGANTCANGKVVIASEAGIAMSEYGGAAVDVSLNELVLNGVVSPQTAQDTLTITGSITGTGSTPTLVLGNSAVIKPTYAGALTLTGSLSGTPMFELPTDINTVGKILLLKADTVDHLPALTGANIVDGLPKGFALKQTNDGLGWVVQKKSFTINIR